MRSRDALNQCFQISAFKMDYSSSSFNSRAKRLVARINASVMPGSIAE
jgi:hypothetical protein